MDLSRGYGLRQTSYVCEVIAGTKRYRQFAIVHLLKFQRCNLTIPCFVQNNQEILRNPEQAIPVIPRVPGGHRKAGFAVSCTLAASPPESSFPRTPGRWALENRRIGPPKNLQKPWLFMAFPGFSPWKLWTYLQRLDYAGFDIWEIFILVGG